MKILITGSKGYIGTALYNTLQRKYEVVGLGKKDLDLTNLNDVKEFLKNKYFDVIIHCAITGGNRLDIDNSNILDNNLKMFYNLVECESNFGKLIHFGSGAEKQNTFYGLSKKVINESIKNKDKFYNVRILAVFDENELATKFVKTNIFNYINKKDIEIFQNKYMDFFHMNDFISLIEYYVENNSLPKEINCCYNDLVSMLDIIDIINGLDSYKVDINFKINTFRVNYIGDFTDLGLEFTGLEQGIKNVYNKLKNEY